MLTYNILELDHLVDQIDLFAQVTLLGLVLTVSL